MSTSRGSTSRASQATGARLTLVELLGPPGVGKTTIARQLLRDGPHWVDARRLVEPLRLPRGLAPPWLHRLAHRLPAVIGSRLMRVPTTAERAAALLQVEDRWRDFIALCADPPVDPDLTPTMRLLTRGWLLDTLLVRALVEVRRDDPGPFGGWHCLLDEGLTHPYKMEAVAPPATESAARRTRLLATVPLPNLTVVFDAGPGLIFERLEERRRQGRPTERHRAMDSKALRREAERTCSSINEVVGAIRSRGGPVLVLDAEQPASVLVRQIVAATHDA